MQTAHCTAPCHCTLWQKKTADNMCSRLHTTPQTCNAFRSLCAWACSVPRTPSISYENSQVHLSAILPNLPCLPSNIRVCEGVKQAHGKCQIPCQIIVMQPQAKRQFLTPPYELLPRHGRTQCYVAAQAAVCACAHALTRDGSQVRKHDGMRSLTHKILDGHGAARPPASRRWCRHLVGTMSSICGHSHTMVRGPIAQYLAVHQSN